MSRTAWFSVLTSAAIVCGAAGAASAQMVNCNTLPGPIYLAGSTAVQPVVKAMAIALAKQANPANTLVYQSQGSCTGVTAILNDATPMGACTQGACITGSALFWDNMGAQQMCMLDAAPGTHVDVGVSDVFAKTCTGMDPPANIGDFKGFVQPFSIIVNSQSSQVEITAEAAYLVFGLAAAGQVSPWIDPMQYFIRNSSSGTQNVIANRIKVPAGKMKGVDAGGAGGVLQKVGTANPFEPAIGIIGTANVDTSAMGNTVKFLAFRAFDQWFAYYPNSTSSSTDKRNVRDGHYVLWGYLNMITQVDNMGVPTNAKAKLFTDWISGKQAGPWGEISDLIIKSGNVPTCAMTVQISAEGGDESLYADPAYCGCYFEKLAAGGSCTACTKDGDCPNNGKCRRSVCEVK